MYTPLFLQLSVLLVGQKHNLFLFDDSNLAFVSILLEVILQSLKSS